MSIRIPHKEVMIVTKAMIDIVEKAAAPIGTVRQRADGWYKKVKAEGKKSDWKYISDLNGKPPTSEPGEQKEGDDSESEEYHTITDLSSKYDDVMTQLFESPKVKASIEIMRKHATIDPNNGRITYEDGADGGEIFAATEIIWDQIKKVVPAAKKTAAAAQDIAGALTYSYTSDRALAAMWTLNILLGHEPGKNMPPVAGIETPTKEKLMADDIPVGIPKNTPFYKEDYDMNDPEERHTAFKYKFEEMKNALGFGIAMHRKITEQLLAGRSPVALIGRGIEKEQAYQLYENAARNNAGKITLVTRPLSSFATNIDVSQSWGNVSFQRKVDLRDGFGAWYSNPGFEEHLDETEVSLFAHNTKFDESQVIINGESDEMIARARSRINLGYDNYSREGRAVSVARELANKKRGSRFITRQVGNDYTEYAAYNEASKLLREKSKKYAGESGLPEHYAKAEFNLRKGELGNPIKKYKDNVQVYKTSSGEEVVVKDYKAKGVSQIDSNDRVQLELAASQVYESLGVGTAYVNTIYDKNDGYLKVMSRHLSDDEYESIGDYLESGKQIDKKAAAGLLIASALTSNFDVVGIDSTNVRVDKKTGTPYVIDTGGSFYYRAQGEKRDYGEPESVEENLNTLRDPSINPQTARLFEGVTDDDIKEYLSETLKQRNAMSFANFVRPSTTPAFSHQDPVHDQVTENLEARYRHLSKKFDVQGVTVSASDYQKKEGPDFFEHEAQSSTQGSGSSQPADVSWSQYSDKQKKLEEEQAKEKPKEPEKPKTPKQLYKEKLKETMNKYDAEWAAWEKEWKDSHPGWEKDWGTWGKAANQWDKDKFDKFKAEHPEYDEETLYHEYSIQVKGMEPPDFNEPKKKKIGQKKIFKVPKKPGVELTEDEIVDSVAALEGLED